MMSNRKLLVINETRPSTDIEYFLFDFEKEYNVDNVYPGYERHANVINAIMRIPEGHVTQLADWAQEDGHGDHEVNGEHCDEGDKCICGPVFTLPPKFDSLEWTMFVKHSEAYPIYFDPDSTNELYEMRKAYNEEHGIVETVKIVSVDENWNILD